MSTSLASIRSAIKTTLEASITNLVVYDKAGDVVQSPSAVLVPKNENTSVSFTGTGGVFEFEIIVMTERQPLDVAQKRIDDLIDKSLSTSIPRVIDASPTLGLSGVDAYVGKMSDYGKEYVSQGVTYIGAVLQLKVVVT
jgi:hypothetical protein